MRSQKKITVFIPEEGHPEEISFRVKVRNWWKRVKRRFKGMLHIR